MFQFVPCITSLNYLWGKFHTDVNTISIVIRKIWFYPGLTHFIILQERRKQSLGSYIDDIFLPWYSSYLDPGMAAILSPSQAISILPRSRQTGTKRLMRLFTQIENVRMRHFYKQRFLWLQEKYKGKLQLKLFPSCSVSGSSECLPSMNNGVLNENVEFIYLLVSAFRIDLKKV